MVPDVSIYSAFIDAVFGVPENPEHFIPYSVADRAPRERSGVIDTFLRILEVLPGRFGVSEVLALLESSAVQRRFGIAELEKIRCWIEQCAIRWGIDSEHRALLGLPPFSENSWRHGLDRMLLGYAMRPDARELFEGILPFDEVEGSDAGLLGNFVEFLEHLFARATDCARPRSLRDWQSDLLAAVDEFLDADETAQLELNQLRAALAELSRISAASGNEDAVSREIVVLQMERVLENASSGAGFLSGAMTFCALKPMRSIPFKVVCLLGMNDTAYPRRDHAPEFDLIAQHRRPGDRNSRADDRALFLEALLSARDGFCLSYVGQSMRDHSPLPPSVVVSELTSSCRATGRRSRIASRSRSIRLIVMQSDSGCWLRHWMVAIWRTRWPLYEPQEPYRQAQPAHCFLKSCARAQECLPTPYAIMSQPKKSRP